MKKLIALLLALAMMLGIATAFAEGGMDELIAAAQDEGELVVYGSCEESYLIAAAQDEGELVVYGSC